MEPGQMKVIPERGLYASAEFGWSVLQRETETRVLARGCSEIC